MHDKSAIKIQFFFLRSLPTSPSPDSPPLYLRKKLVASLNHQSPDTPRNELNIVRGCLTKGGASKLSPI